MRRKHLLAALLSGTTLASCVPAMRKPPPLMDLAGGGKPPPAADAGPLLREAEILFARREPGCVREAVRVWVKAAAADPAQVEGLYGAVRGLIWLVDHEESREVQKADATAAVQAAQWCLELAHGDPACAYWLGAALGVQARERKSTGLDALPRIEEAFKTAASEAPELERGGPDRALALLYLRAPGWPKGPGDPDLGLEHAEKAVALDPAYPPNQLALGEALEATEDPAGARTAYRRALTLARRLTEDGHPDAAEWVREAEKALGPSKQE